MINHILDEDNRKQELHYFQFPVFSCGENSPSATHTNVRSFIWSPQKDLRKVTIQTVSPLNSLLCFDSCNAWIVCCLNYVADGRIFL